MKKLSCLLALVGLLSLTACSEDENNAPSITILSQQEELLLGAEANSRLDVDFSSTADWKASVNVDWAIVSPSLGTSGNVSVSILSKEMNRTGEIRTGTLLLTSNEVRQEVVFRQAAVDVLNVVETQYAVPAAGQQMTIEFNTNVSYGKARLTFAVDEVGWITFGDNPQTRALQTGSLGLTVEPNKSLSSRTTKLYLQLLDNEEKVLLQSPAITISQDAATVGTSVDLVTDDKKVVVLQTHTKGNGIPMIFMGDGFLDTDVSGGYYLQVMQKAVDLFFTEEPVKSLREYFDVWMVTAVSRNNAFGGAFSTKFGCTLEGGGSSGISGKHDIVKTYAQAVPEMTMNPQLLDEALIVVVLNTEEYAGTTYFGFSTNGVTSEYAIGYCPIIDGLDSDMFRRVLCHECIGHGFAKLLDEYSYQSMGTIPAAEIESNRRIQNELGWAMNVDFVNDRSMVRWKHFLTDERYRGADAYGETLGVYEGACTYWNGAWRPTEESMMRSNMHGFNAPSREAIYKRVMRTAYGPLWVYDYETFVAFDRAHLPQPLSTQTRAVQDTPSKPFARPRILE